PYVLMRSVASQCALRLRAHYAALAEDRNRAVPAVGAEPFVRLFGLAGCVWRGHTAYMAGGAGRLVQVLGQFAASFGEGPTLGERRGYVAVLDRDIAAERLGRAFRGMVDVESDDHRSVSLVGICKWPLHPSMECTAWSTRNLKNSQVCRNL